MDVAITAESSGVAGSGILLMESMIIDTSGMSLRGRLARPAPHRQKRISMVE